MIFVVALYFAFTLGYWAADRGPVEACLDDQVRLYGDLCAESSSGYESMSGSDAHVAGVDCAVAAAKECMHEN